MSDLSTQLIDANDLLRRLDAMTPTEAGEFYANVQMLKANFRAWCGLVESGLIDYMTEKRMDIPIVTAKGEKRLYIGTDKKTRNPNPTDTLARLLTATGGDLNAVAECLSSGAWKPGACREVLGDEWGSCFTVEEVASIETGAPKRVLKTTQEE